MITAIQNTFLLGSLETETLPPESLPLEKSKQELGLLGVTNALTEWTTEYITARGGWERADLGRGEGGQLHRKPKLQGPSMSATFGISPRVGHWPPMDKALCIIREDRGTQELTVYP